MVEHGHSLTVFAAGAAEGHSINPAGFATVRITASDRRQFAAALVPELLRRDACHPFDLIEAPEIGPEGMPAFQALPRAARVLRLHTPTYLVNRLGAEPASLKSRLRFWLGALRRGRWQTLPGPAPYHSATDPEACCARSADAWISPSKSLGDILVNDWWTDHAPAPVSVVPYPYVPPAPLLALAPPEKIRTLAFLGRLEPRKGVLEFAAAIPEILKYAPDVRVKFIGPSWPSALGDMRSHLARRLARHQAAIKFSGAIAPAELPGQLAGVDAVILPSRWENFPFACWESLAAARVVIGSAAGGMAEVIEHGVSGLLVPPRDPSAIRDAVLSIVDDPRGSRTMAESGRARITTLLAPERVLPLQIASYERAIARAALRRSVPA